MRDATRITSSIWQMDNLPILLSLLVVLITIVLFTYFFVRKKVKRNGILLMGLSESGKTLIFARLAYEKFVDTFTSMKENVSSYSLGKGTFQLIDIPGQERVRGRVFDKYKASARGIAFVVDSGKVQQEIRDIAEYLHNVLIDETIYTNQPDVLILCNKQDEPLGKSSNSVRALLEKEMNIVRTTKASQRKLAADDSIPERSLGDKSKIFKFEDLPFKISFAESTAIMADEDTGPNLNELMNWIKTLA